jgi:hypothetical protein
MMKNDKEHQNWLKKFNKRKEGKIFNLLHDIESLELNLKSYDKLSYLSSALCILAKNTKYEEDVKKIIQNIYPDFFQD